MIHILLLILKIIGIILLAVLALTVLVLFFPISYVGMIAAQEGNVTAGAMGYWLFHIVHFRLRFEDKKMIYKLRVFGIPVTSSEKKEEEPEGKRGKKQKHKRTEKQKTSDSEKQKQDSNIREELKQQGEEQKQEEKEAIEEKTDENIKTEKEEKKENKKQKTKSIDRIKAWTGKVKGIFRKVIHNIKGVYNKVKEVIQFLTDNATKEAYNYGKKIVMKLLKHIFPRRIRADVHFGFEEPHTTGQVLGYLALFYGIFGVNPKKINVEPDFENKVFEGVADLKGHIILGVVVYYALRFYFKKEIHDIIKKFS